MIELSLSGKRKAFFNPDLIGAVCPLKETETTITFAGQELSINNPVDDGCVICVSGQKIRVAESVEEVVNKINEATMGLPQNQ